MDYLLGFPTLRLSNPNYMVSLIRTINFTVDLKNLANFTRREKRLAKQYPVSETQRAVSSVKLNRLNSLRDVCIKTTVYYFQMNSWIKFNLTKSTSFANFKRHSYELQNERKPLLIEFQGKLIRFFVANLWQPYFLFISSSFQRSSGFVSRSYLVDISIFHPFTLSRHSIRCPSRSGNQPEFPFASFF